MKQLWYGAALLAALLITSICLGSALEEIHHQSARDLDKAASAALEEDWALASALAARAGKEWQARRNLTAALCHHDPIEQIDTTFPTLELYATRRESGSFAVTCVQLARQIRALPQSHSFSWWNLL